ncbi:wax ester/triacylglycerol synthase family O-acyltransferase [Myxococcaceae bacterium GXIMD 01537]
MDVSERMGQVDAAWLQMEEPVNLMMVTAVLWFEQPLDPERLREVVRSRLVGLFPRFRQRVVMPEGLLGLPRWEDDPSFDLDAHLLHETLPSPGDRAVLEERVSHWMSVPLDRSRPLWQLHLIDAYGQGCALLARIHHSISDGIALARVLLSLTDAEPQGAFVPPPPSEAAREEGSGLGRLLRGVRTVASTTRAVWKRGGELVAEPIHLGDLLREGVRGATTAGRLVAMAPDPSTPLRGTLGTRKRAVWSTPVPLETLRAIKDGTQSTVNDVLLCALTGALRRYLETRGGPVEDVRAVVPVNLRPLDEPVPSELGNRFGLVFLTLPVSEPDARRRLRAVQRRMEDLKRSPEAALTFGALNVLGLAPAPVERVVVDTLGTRASLIVTNVPGPRAPVYLAGTRLGGLMFWVPQAARLALGVSLFSYAGQATVGVAVDASVIPDPGSLVEGFHRELAELARL